MGSAKTRLTRRARMRRPGHWLRGGSWGSCLTGSDRVRRRPTRKEEENKVLKEDSS